MSMDLIRPLCCYSTNNIKSNISNGDADERSADDVRRVMDSRNHTAHGYEQCRYKKEDAQFFVIEIDDGRHREEKSRMSRGKRPCIVGKQLMNGKRQERPRAVIKKTNEFGSAKPRNDDGNAGYQKYN